MRGRKPKPIQQQINEGDPRKRGVHKLEERLEAEPKASRGLPPCPHHLSDRARTAWNFWRDELELMGLAFGPDAAMLEGAVVMYARAVEADLILQRDGLTLETPVLNPKGDQI